MPDLPPVRRPNGIPYRPRKLAAETLTDDDGLDCAVLVLGTHDRVTAQPLADESVRRYCGTDYAAVNPVPGWWRNGFEGGERVWADDPVTGRAGLRFEITEKPFRGDTGPDE